MKIFLAGITSRPFVMHNYMKVYLAGAHSRGIKDWGDHEKGMVSEAMKIFLAESGGVHRAYTEPAGELKNRICILESFYYINDWMIPYIKDYWDFLLDSGAYTFLVNAEKTINWLEYLENYINFIKDNDIKHFFELDIDSVIGYKKVKEMRKILEEKTEKQCIPVWHRSRGKEEWLKLIKEYNYVAVGGIAIKDINKNEYPIFTWLLRTAKKENCKVHGLGFTQIPLLKKYPFYSVDSTAWIYGNRGGFLYKFTGNNIIKIKKPGGTRLKPREVAIHNFKQWVAFQKYAQNNL